MPPSGGIAGGITTELAPDYPRQVNMKLSTQQINHTKPSSKAIRLFDGNGLYLEISPSGNKHWRQKYRFNGKEYRLSHGSYPTVSLDEARALRDDALTHLQLQ